nr:hypothetical protein Iba_chr13dCG7090 [Ipomoea batatas]
MLAAFELSKITQVLRKKIGQRCLRLLQVYDPTSLVDEQGHSDSVTTGFALVASEPGSNWRSLMWRGFFKTKVGWSASLQIARNRHS